MLPRLCLQGVSRTLRDRVAALATSTVQLQLVGKTVQTDVCYQLR